METVEEWSSRPPHIRPLPAFGGHLALDFANTVDDPEGPARYDHIADLTGYLGWALRADLLDEAAARTLRDHGEHHPEQTTDALAQAAALRDALNATFGAVVDHEPPDAGWHRLRPFVLDALETAELAVGTTGDPSGGPLHWGADDLGAPMRPVAHAALQLLHAPELRRVKRCAGCPWLFLDASRNGSRRWCSMTDCGTHAKIQRYVTKRAAARGRPRTG
ncbi:CGNR zinc finger domain-containing protein [Desertihabitans aurantiacus]|uniref:CGNR zinc finger domain-containing protein n=1 Tax=Desertihabitans aurantiacus TaxID=2282477 RepID=UPI0018E5928B|nr:CGNR zinc finger domain-containing protein [Desertihabitans aurantiacus]